MGGHSALSTGGGGEIFSMLFLTPRQELFQLSPAVTPNMQGGPMFFMSSPPGLLQLLFETFLLKISLRKKKLVFMVCNLRYRRPTPSYVAPALLNRNTTVPGIIVPSDFPVKQNAGPSPLTTAQF